MTVRSAFLVATVLLLLSACTSDGESGGTTLQDNGGDQTLVLTDDEAREAADPSQLAVLDEEGEIAFSDYRRAVNKSLDCMRDAGIAVAGDNQIDRSRGFPVISYSFSASSSGRDDEATKAAADDCLYRYSFLIERDYQTQTSSVEAEEAQFEENRPAIIACLADAGRSLPEDVSNDELREVAFDVLTEVGIDCEA